MHGFVLIIVILIVVVGISIYIGWVATHGKRLPLDAHPAHVGLLYDDVIFEAVEDRVTLSGWFTPSNRSSATIIMAHGIGANRLEPALPALDLARSLHRANFNVFMFDFRNSGESGGTVTTIGYHEVRDVLGAIAWLKSNRTEAAKKIGLLGFSMGAVTSILAAARDPAIDAVVADSPFADLHLYLRENMSVWTGLPNFPFTQIAMALVPPLIGLDVAAVSPIQAMPELDQPIFIIHGQDDRLIPVVESEKLAAVNPHVKLWLVPKADHVGARDVDPNTYDETVIAFFKQSMGRLKVRDEKE